MSLISCVLIWIHSQRLLKKYTKLSLSARCRLKAARAWAVDYSVAEEEKRACFHSSPSRVDPSSPCLGRFGRRCCSECLPSAVSDGFFARSFPDTSLSPKSAARSMLPAVWSGQRCWQVKQSVAIVLLVFEKRSKPRDQSAAAKATAAES